MILIDYFNDKNKIKAFSLIELIIIIAIISIIAIVAIPKLGDSLTKAKQVKIKSDILLIRGGLRDYKDNMIVSNQNITLESLDENSNILFSKILQYPIISNNNHKISTWEKLSNNKYIVWIDLGLFLEFEYNSDDFTFNCDKKNKNCKEFSNLVE